MGKPVLKCILTINPIAQRKANFGLSESNKLKVLETIEFASSADPL